MPARRRRNKPEAGAREEQIGVSTRQSRRRQQNQELEAAEGYIEAHVCSELCEHSEHAGYEEEEQYQGTYPEDEAYADEREMVAEEEEEDDHSAGGRGAIADSADDTSDPVMLGDSNRPTLLGYLRDEVFRGSEKHGVPKSDMDMESRGRVFDFTKVPLAVEKLIFFGFFACLDIFLHVFTILVIRLGVACWRLVRSAFSLQPLTKAYVCDILRVILLAACIYLSEFVDVSYIYHNIRGQSAVKLYVIVNVVETFDRLFASFGQDVLDSFISYVVDSKQPRGRRYLMVVVHFFLSIFYICIHSLVLLYQVLALNVAINSHNNALLTIVISNQYIEIKSSVFKRLDITALFQVTCADIRERFLHVCAFCLIAIRNLSEFGWSLSYLYDNLLLPFSMVFFSELVVDWVKHAFVARFNKLDASGYRDMMAVICSDVVSSSQDTNGINRGQRLKRRLGFSPLPVACLVWKLCASVITFPEGWMGALVFAGGFLALLCVKVVLGVVLVRFSQSFKHRPSPDYARLCTAGVRDPLDRTKVPGDVPPAQ